MKDESIREREQKIYKNWEDKGYFKPEINPNGKPYSIILPPPNANAPLHFGHAMYVLEDILVRFHRMKGYRTLWLPGADHAGFETQYVFEKKLRAEGKSRMDFDRETLFKMIWDYVSENRGGMEDQLRSLGFSLDWTRQKFTMDPDIVKVVYRTFKKMYDENLIYRSKRLVNYCTVDQTSFSDLEVIYKEKQDPLYYIQYGPLVLATTRPETKFGDTALAVNPKDTRYKEYVGKKLEIEDVLGKSKIKVIADEAVDPEFGTGVVKVTPAHDFTDFEISQRHGLPIIQVINFNGTMNEKAGKYAGLYIKQARRAVVEDLTNKGLIVKVDLDYLHRVGVCYKCGTVIEPLPLEQWFVDIKPLAKKGIGVVKKGEIKIYPKNFEKTYFQFLESIRDWNISRQNVWGIRIPAFKNKKSGEWIVTEGENPGEDFEQDMDTFDTWFSSAQWPFATLQTTKPGDFETFYPTSVLETGYDILRWWVARMVMIGVYETGEVPFRDVVLHGLVKDPEGRKMSKSKGNVINPIELVEQYGADAVRFALVYGSALGNDQALSYQKLEAAKKFVNKLRNIVRFVLEMKPQETKTDSDFSHADDQALLEKFDETKKTVEMALEKYDFNLALSEIYEFIWHYFADIYLEKSKDRRGEAQPALEKVLQESLKLLHPFMPFITEEFYLRFPNHEESIMISKWPK